jgi:ornithine decarboxylase
MVVQRALRIFGSGVQFALEPGRSLVADAGTIETTVVGKAERAGHPWFYVDLSIYAGLLEIRDGWVYPIETDRDHLPKRRATLAGPTCDSTDVLARDVALPDLELGDRVRLLTTGAYTIAWRSFNGFRFPDVVLSGGGSFLQDAAA